MRLPQLRARQAEMRWRILLERRPARCPFHKIPCKTRVLVTSGEVTRICEACRLEKADRAVKRRLERVRLMEAEAITRGVRWGSTLGIFS